MIKSHPDVRDKMNFVQIDSGIWYGCGMESELNTNVLKAALRWD